MSRPNVSERSECTHLAQGKVNLGRHDTTCFFLKENETWLYPGIEMLVEMVEETSRASTASGRCGPLSADQGRFGLVYPALVSLDA